MSYSYQYRHPSSQYYLVYAMRDSLNSTSFNLIRASQVNAMRDSLNGYHRCNEETRRNPLIEVGRSISLVHRKSMPSRRCNERDYIHLPSHILIPSSMLSCLCNEERLGRSQRHVVQSRRCYLTDAMRYEQLSSSSTACRSISSIHRKSMLSHRCNERDYIDIPSHILIPPLGHTLNAMKRLGRSLRGKSFNLVTLPLNAISYRSQ
jgi:hypothetical protein